MTAEPSIESERRRRMLEVDVAICTACRACERDCPIDVIVIAIEKVDGERRITRFDIDLATCTRCGICVDSCPQEAQAPDDPEPTKCIRFTQVPDEHAAPASLTLRFIAPGERVTPFKPQRGAIVRTPPRGEISRELRLRAERAGAE